MRPQVQRSFSEGEFTSHNARRAFHLDFHLFHRVMCSRFAAYQSFLKFVFLTDVHTGGAVSHGISRLNGNIFSERGKA